MNTNTVTMSEYKAYSLESIRKSIALFQAWRDASDFNSADTDYKSFVITTLNALIAQEREMSTKLNGVYIYE